jgi:hypothetical protein
MDGSLKNGHLIKILEFLLSYIRDPFMPELVPRFTFIFKAGFIGLSQGISRVINLDLAILRYRYMRVNVSGESNTL